MFHLSQADLYLVLAGRMKDQFIMSAQLLCEHELQLARVNKVKEVECKYAAKAMNQDFYYY